MKIGEVAKRIGASISALRFYEQKGLIDAGRSRGGTRCYSDEDVGRFRAIVDLSRVQIPLESLADLTRIRSGSRSGDRASRQVEVALADMAANLENRIESMQAALADLRSAQQRLAGCHGCQKRPTRSNCSDCPTAAPLLECSVMRIVWDTEAGHG